MDCKIEVKLKTKSYDIFIEDDAIMHIDKFVDVNRKVLIITDNGVPKYYADLILSKCPQGYVEIVTQGESSKSFNVYKRLLKALLAYNFSRKDLVIALGGGVVGDLAGFAAATYMRGIEFVGVPTTTLSQIDSSIGGKVGISLRGIKNVIGAFHQPKCVVIDNNTLSTLPKRHFNNGLVEALKIGLTCDKELVELFETENIEKNVKEIIRRSLILKKNIVEEDEKEENLRKVLNFGHTIGHGIESVFGLSEVLHGEAVAFGMLPMIENNKLKQRVVRILEKLSINCNLTYDKQAVYNAMINDKKAYGNLITIVKVKEAGSYVLEEIPIERLIEFI